MKWWQRPFTVHGGDGTAKSVELRPIRHLTRDLRVNPLAYDALVERLTQAREWLKERGK